MAGVKMEKNVPLRDLMDKWDAQLRLEREEKIKDMLNNSLLFFFQKNGEFFGGPEESRLIFAKLKDPDEDVTPAWNDEAAFMAINLSRALESDDPPKRLFYKRDMDGLKVIDKDDLEKLLFKKKK
jgi:hypothetical protein